MRGMHQKVTQKIIRDNAYYKNTPSHMYINTATDCSAREIRKSQRAVQLRPVSPLEPAHGRNDDNAFAPFVKREGKINKKNEVSENFKHFEFNKNQFLYCKAVCACTRSCCN